MIKMYGIPNCNSIKKAKDWLEAHDITYEFHNYKKEGIDNETLQTWVNQVGWKTLLNQRGTTWRKLSIDDKENINQTKSIQLMCVYPSMIKRPVLITDDKTIVGFDDTVYAEALKT